MSVVAAFAALADGWVDGFCAACDGPRLAYELIVNPPKPPALVGPPEGGRQSPPHWVPSKRRLLRTVRLLEYFHGVRGTRQSVSLAELARAVEAGDDGWLLADSLVGGCSYLQEYRRRTQRGLPRQRYVRLVVRNPWKTLADVIELLGRGDEGGAEVDLVARVFDSLCPDFRKLLPKGLRSLRDLFAAFPGTFVVSSEVKVRCVVAFDDPQPEREIAACYRNDVHTREDLEGLVALAQAAADYPGVKCGSGIPVEALHAWGRARHAGVPCWRGIGSFRRFLHAFRKSGYYRLGEGKVLSDGRRGAGCRIKAMRTVIRVVGEADGFACCETVADIVSRWVPGFGGRLDKAGFVRYVRDLKGGDFVLDGDDRIADRLVASDVRGHVACWYYARYLAKQRALGEGLLRGDSERDFGAGRYSRVAAWVARSVVQGAVERSRRIGSTREVAAVPEKAEAGVPVKKVAERSHEEPGNRRPPFFPSEGALRTRDTLQDARRRPARPHPMERRRAARRRGRPARPAPETQPGCKVVRPRPIPMDTGLLAKPGQSY